MKILITRGGGTGPMIPRQRIRYEYCANSSKVTWKIRKKLILTVYAEASFYLLERGFFMW